MKKDYRLIDLNVWMGKKFDELIDFVEREKSDTDIFCFQEVTHIPEEREETGEVRFDLFGDLQRVLSDFNSYFEYAKIYEAGAKEEFSFGYGEAIFWKKDLKVVNQEVRFIHRKNPHDVFERDGWWESPRTVLLVDLLMEEKVVRIANVHGIWEPGPKIDTPARLEQAKKLDKVFEDTPTVLVGDLNLGIDNESLRMIENGRRSLVKESGVKSTRSSFYLHEGKFADYAIVDKEIEIKKFKVLGDEVSDHLPLELIFSV